MHVADSAFTAVTCGVDQSESSLSAVEESRAALRRHRQSDSLVSGGHGRQSRLPTQPRRRFHSGRQSFQQLKYHLIRRTLHCTARSLSRTQKIVLFVFFCASFSFATVSLVRAVAYLAGFAYVLP